MSSGQDHLLHTQEFVQNIIVPHWLWLGGVPSLKTITLTVFQFSERADLSCSQLKLGTLLPEEVWLNARLQYQVMVQFNIFCCPSTTWTILAIDTCSKMSPLCSLINYRWNVNCHYLFGKYICKNNCFKNF